ncbi:flippase [Bifidobacterium eulemuris]|uniref:Flippase n=1 Tax=Bifidobacterium eulemuris TaxID=1765219 RepID=A0A261FYZ7_9BIFI|nr:MATE family efflux transporter [Bifidobacterium eulemuris]OZG64367.1 flippase [Bifidobacterium eulemuris]QOL32432.1 MATE family efflux transporter [Bifidobacterium eulemuris]
MGNKKQFVINLAASLVNFAVNLGIGFAITPFIVGRVGAEAYGFVGLANNMVGYATLFTIALNSVAGRFITVAWHRGDKRKADGYFSSTLAANVLLVLMLSAVAVPLILRLERVINISPHLVADVKCLFFFVYLNFVVSALSTVLSVATFVMNRLYLSSLANIAYSLTRVVVMVVCFALFPTYVLFVGMATCLGTLVMAGLNYSYTRRLTPELRFRKSAVSWRTTWEMLSSGVWNTVIKLQQILQDGLSLLIANLAVSPLHMGYLSIAQVVPNALSGLMGTISGLFSPEQTRLFAQGRPDELFRELASSMRITGFFTNIVFVTLLVNGETFIALWQPGQDARMIYVLMMLTMGGFFLSGVANTLQGVPLLVNRLRNYSLAWLGCGAASLVLTLACVELTDWGIYAVGAVPQLVGFVANLTFVPIYAARCLRIRQRRFYLIYLQYIAATALAAALGYWASASTSAWHGGWPGLLAGCALTALITCAVDALVLLGRRERSIIVRRIVRK